MQQTAVGMSGLPPALATLGFEDTQKKLKHPTAIKVLVLCHPNQFDDPVQPH